MKVRELAKKHEDEIIAWRREFHENPELSGEEIRTGNRICEELTKMNIELKRIAKTGVLGTLKGNKPGKTVALPVKEVNNIPYRSKNKKELCMPVGMTAISLCYWGRPKY